MQICHRNLSLESVVVRKKSNTSSRVEGGQSTGANFNNDTTCYQCTITQLGNAVHVPSLLSLQQDDPQDAEHLSTTMATSYTPLLSAAGRNPQYVAPELWYDHSESDTLFCQTTDTAVQGGYAADLWSAGVMLLAMLMGSEALFAIPFPADPVFRRITHRQHLKEYIETQQTKSRPLASLGGCAKDGNTTSTTIISEEAVDLLQRMLRVDPHERMTLADLVQHPWLCSDGKSLA